MRSTSILLVALAALVPAACSERADPVSVGSEEDPSALFFGKRIVYQVTTLPTLGGSSASGQSITNRGWVAGYSNNPGNATRQATVWRDGELTPLGTLPGGPNSTVVWPGQNLRGTVVGISSTGELDPEGKKFSCYVFFPDQIHTGHKCRGFVWDGGAMRELPPLGGNNSFASTVNNRGQIVGWAETAVRDPTCLPESQTLQFRAVVWGPGEGDIRELPPYPGDSTSAAVHINDRGQVVGISGDCDQAVGRHSARHAVLWDRGEVIDLGNIGGDTWNTPTYINLRGDIVGFAGLSEDEGGPGPLQAFLWTRRDGMQRLDPPEGCTGAQAHSVNLRRQIVGAATGCPEGPEKAVRAFIWERGVMRDLNEFVDDPDLFLVDATVINDRGWITGEALDLESGESMAYIARPKLVIPWLPW